MGAKLCIVIVAGIAVWACRSVCSDVPLVQRQREYLVTVLMASLRIAKS